MNMKLFRDVLPAKGYRTLEATPARRRSSWRRARAGSRAHGHRAAGHRRRRGAAPATGGRAHRRDTVLALTARRCMATMSVLAAGFDGYVSKPVNVAELVAPSGATAREANVEPSCARILVVDDTAAGNVRLLEAVLGPGGVLCQALSAASGLGGALANDQGGREPDVVLLDVLMPGMDGHEVCRRLRAQLGDDVPLGPDDHRRWRASRRWRRSRPEPTTSSPSPSTAPSCWRGSAPCCGIKRYQDTIKAQAAELLDLNRTLRRKREARRNRGRFVI